MARATASSSQKHDPERKGPPFEKGGIRNQSWCQYIRWCVCLKARIVWRGAIRSHSRCQDSRRRVFLKAMIVWCGSEVTPIRIAFCKKNIAIGLETIGLVENAIFSIQLPNPVSTCSKKKLTQTQLG